MRTILLITFIALAMNRIGSLVAQQPTTPQTEQPASTTEDKPTASPEQELLKKWVGTWDATIETTGRDGKPVTTKAKSTVKLAYGNRWLITDFDGTFMGAPFTGQEVLGYDPVAKKYILNWIDATSTSFSTGEGTFESKTNTLTKTVSGRDDSTGKMATWRQVDTWKDADTHEWTIRVTGKDGKEQIQMTIKYRRHR